VKGLGIENACILAACVFLIGSTATAQTPAAGSAERGKELYLAYSCYACHGYDGHGGAGARLVPLAMTVTRFTAYVHNPRRMPPYTDKVLSDPQLADLFAYIKSLRRRPRPIRFRCSAASSPPGNSTTGT